MATEKNVGKIVEIKGVVIDAVFRRAPEHLQRPAHRGPRAGRPPAVDLIAEIAASRERRGPRGGDGLDRRLPRGADVEDTGAPISCPVGEATLGRIFNVLGAAIDEGEWRASAGRHPPAARPASEGSVSVQIFETGIKVIDLLAPYVKGGKVGLFGGTGVGKTITSRS